MGEMLYIYDDLYINGTNEKSTPQQIKALEYAREFLLEIIWEKTGINKHFNDSDADNFIFSFLRKELENGTHYFFNQRGGFEKRITTTILEEVKAFIKQENQARGGNMTPEECFTMAVCFFKGVQSQQKHGWREVTEMDLSKIISDVVPGPKKSRMR